MSAVSAALRLLTVNFKTALVILAGFATVNFIRVAYVLVCVVVLLPTHTVAGLPYDALLLEPALTFVVLTAGSVLMLTAAAGMVSLTSSSGSKTYGAADSKTVSKHTQH